MWWHTGGKNSVNLKGLLNLQPKQLFAKLKQSSLIDENENYIKKNCSSEKERKVNALALRAEEGRDNLRKATVSWK